MLQNQIENLRTEYALDILSEEQLPAGPFVLFEQWLEDALSVNAVDAHCMVLSSVSETQQPSSRIVLLRSIDKEKFGFFTNYNSRKGKHLQQNPKVALHFFWSALERQVEVQGSVVKMSEAESENYFYSRPRENQLAAWSSHQSTVINGREFIDSSYRSYQRLFDKATEIPRPSYWGGYYVIPQQIEFWQGRPNRLHDRILYSRNNENDWKIERLSP